MDVRRLLVHDVLEAELPALTAISDSSHFACRALLFAPKCGSSVPVPRYGHLLRSQM